MAQNDLLVKIADAGEPVSAKDLGVTAAALNELFKAGLVKRKGARKSGGRGRPSHLWALTSKATKRVKRIREAEKKEKQTKAAEKAVEVVGASTPAA